MGDLTIAELRDMNPAERAAHAAAQQERWVMAAIPEVGKIDRDRLVAHLRGWMQAKAVDETLERLRAAGRVGGSFGPGGYVWPTPKDGVS